MGRATRAVRRKNTGFETFRGVKARQRTIDKTIRRIVDGYGRFVITFGGARRAPDGEEKR